MELLGFEIKRKEEENEEKVLQSFAKPEQDDGSIQVAGGGTYGSYIDLDGETRNESDLINRYRQMSTQAEVDEAIQDIINEAIVIDEDQPPVEIVLDDLEYSDSVKEKIRDEFNNIIEMLDFQNGAYEIFRKWYIDGRLYHHLIINPKQPKKGIQEIRYIDPRKIKKIREYKKDKDARTGATLYKGYTDYFLYNPSGMKQNAATGSQNGIKIAADSISYVHSGVLDHRNSIIYSHLHKAIKPHNQLRMLEDAVVIYRLARAPERRIFNIDVGNLPKAKAEQYINEMMTKHKNKLIYNAQTGEIKDDRRFMCYALDTKIPLLDGRTLELQEIMKEYEGGKTNWVYSCDPVTGKFYPGPVSWAGITKRNSDVVRITFDNGKSVTCTPDHKFPVWNKGFVEAQYLTPEDSIIPGYRRYEKITENGPEYEQIFKNETQEWEFTHREVGRWKESVGLREEASYRPEYKDSPKTIFHHRDYNRYNNAPENLVMMNHRDHLCLHVENQRIEYTNEIIDAVDHCAKENMSNDETIEHVNNTIDHDSWNGLNFDKNPKNRNSSDLVFTGKDLQRISKMMGHQSWRYYRKDNETFERELNGRKKRAGSSKWSVEHRTLLSEAARNRKPRCKSWKVYTPDNEIEVIENLNEYCRDRNLNRSNIKGKYGSRGYHAEELRNHKIKSVEKLDEKMTVGSMAIDADETYHSHHTYLLDAGVYTKNTMLEDYWFPKRDGRGTSIDTLPGGANLGEMDDVEYFKKKMYKALNVPITRMETENQFNLGRASEITRDEVKFSKFITRLRSRFSMLFTSILEIQLSLKGIIGRKEFKEAKKSIRFDFAKDNHFTEMKEAEILTERLRLLSDVDSYVGTYFSKEWVQKNVLRMSEEDIKKMEKEIKKGKDDPTPAAQPPEGKAQEPAPQPQPAPEPKPPENKNDEKKNKGEEEKPASE